MSLSITPASPSGDGLTTCTYGDAINILATTAYIDFNITINSIDGIVSSTTKRQTFSKSIDGNNGIDGAVVTLSAADQIIDYNSNGDLIENAGNGSGTRKLREFVKYLEQMPGCPYNWVIIHPAGSELTDLYSLHLQSVGYRKTGHTTEDLLKMYKYWLKAKKTKLKAMDFGMEDEGYWRLDCFNPVDPMYEPSSCPFANLLE